MRSNYISIVLTCYNGENTIYETLSSINDQTLEEFELVVIDDGSKDKTPDIIREFNFRKGISVNFICRANKGSLPSLSEGVDNANGDFIARIDHDDLWDKDHLVDLFSIMSQDPKIVLVGTQAEIIDMEGHILARTNCPLSETGIKKRFMNDNPFVHSSVMFRKDAYYKTVGYMCGSDEESTQIADYNLWMELATIGKIMNLDKLSVKYRFQPVSLSRNIKMIKNYKSRLYGMKKAQRLFKCNYFYYLVCTLKVRLNILRWTIMDLFRN